MRSRMSLGPKATQAIGRPLAYRSQSVKIPVRSPTSAPKAVKPARKLPPLTTVLPPSVSPALPTLHLVVWYSTAGVNLVISRGLAVLRQRTNRRPQTSRGKPYRGGAPLRHRPRERARPARARERHRDRSQPDALGKPGARGGLDLTPELNVRPFVVV